MSIVDSFRKAAPDQTVEFRAGEKAIMLYSPTRTGEDYKIPVTVIEKTLAGYKVNTEHQGGIIVRATDLRKI